MWIKTMLLVVHCFAIMACMAEQFTPRRTSLLSNASAEVGNQVGRHRLKRALSRTGYCGQRGCCPGRDDGCSCAFSVRNATCYCDAFCTSDPPGAVDCCPDFWTVCLGRASRHPVPEQVRTAPWQQVGSSDTASSDTGSWTRWAFGLIQWAFLLFLCCLLFVTSCFQGGQHFAKGATFIDNCNSCKCVDSHWHCSDTTCLVEPSLIKQINSGNYGWKASNYSQFWGMSLKEGFNYHLGTFPPSPALLDMRPITESLVTEMDFPEFFVARYEWPGWIHDPLDQRNCSASWAFSTASVAADRIAIHSQGRFTGNLSPQNLISCDTKKDQEGCKGGSIHGAWSYLKKHGLVSYACYPLFWNQPQQKGCAISSEVDVDGKRHATRPCPNNFEPSNHIYQCGSPYRISSQETEIMKEINENGPVQAIMQVYDDFFLYKSGIYKHSRSARGQPNRTHSVKIVGWGALRDPEGQKQKFWIAANSWGRTWGENGYFRILRGQNECDIERLIIAAKCFF